MLILGTFKGTVFIINAGEYRAGLERASELNIADGYLDGKYVIPLLIPGIVRTAGNESIRKVGHGFSNSTEYKFNGGLTFEIMPDGELYNYDSFASSNEKHELSNQVMGRYCGNINNQPFMIFTASPKAQAIVTNALNLTKVRDNVTPMDLVKFIAKQMNSDRYMNSYKTLYTIQHDKLLDSIKRVNDGETKPLVEVESCWDVEVIDDCNNLKVIAFDDVAALTYANAAMWQHHLP